MQQDDIIIDGPQLTRAFRRQIRRWVWIGPLLLGVLLLPALCLVPRSYTAGVSIAIQQPSAGGSALALLAGGGGASKRYIGVLKSRELAESVERTIGLWPLYGGPGGRFRTEFDAVEYLMKNVKPEDNPGDGLLYVTVTLPGPPKFALIHRAPSESQIKDTAARAANAYAAYLKQYYIANDTDQSSVLLRDAQKETLAARAGYDSALEDVLNFNRSLSHVDPRSAPTSVLDASSAGPETGAGVGGDAAATVSGLGGLYTALNQVQAELRTAQAVRQTQQSLTDEQLRSLSSVPADDPLLTTIRNQVKQDQTEYQTSASLYGPENPRVVTARARLLVDQAELNRQIAGVKNRLTTPNIRSDEQIQGLYSRQKTILGQIALAERRLGVHRQLSGEFGRLQAEVALRLEVLKTTLAEAAKIRMENASAQSRMTVIDTAIPPKSGEPGVLKLALACLALVLLAFGAAVIWDYLRPADTDRSQSPLNGSSANGSGMGSLGEPQKEAAPLARK